MELLQENRNMLSYQLELLNKLSSIRTIRLVTQLPFEITHVVQWEQSVKNKSISLELQLSDNDDFTDYCEYSLRWDNRNYSNHLLPIMSGKYGNCKLYLIPTCSTQDHQVESVHTRLSNEPFIEIDRTTDSVCMDSMIDNFILVVVSPYPVTKMEGNTPAVVEQNKYIGDGIHTTIHSVDIINNTLLRFVLCDGFGNVYTKYVDCHDGQYPDAVRTQ